MAESQPMPTDPDPTPQPDPTLNGAIDANINMDLNPDAPISDPHPTQEEPPPEPPAPTKKDISLRDFLSKMDDYAPIVRPPPLTPSFPPLQLPLYSRKLFDGEMKRVPDYQQQIPDAVTAHHLLLAGLPPSTTPLPLQRLLALATQKFIADIAADAYQYSRMRSSNSTANAAATALGPGGVQIGQPAGGGAGAEKGKGAQSSQHVLGVQRAGYGGGGSGGGQGRAVLTMEDLGCAVGEYGVNVKRGEFYR